MTATVLSMTEAVSAPVVTLRQRIADALTKPTTSTEVRACIAHTQAALARAEHDLKKAEAAARNPLSTEQEAVDAKCERESLQFDLDRLTTSLERLTPRLATVEKEEAREAARPAYEAAKAESEAAAQAISDEYPVLASKIAALLKRAASADGVAKGLSWSLPEGLSKLPTVEALVRDRLAYFESLPKNFSDYTTEPSELAQRVRLPALPYADARRGRYHWDSGEQNYG